MSKFDNPISPKDVLIVIDTETLGTRMFDKTIVWDVGAVAVRGDGAILGEYSFLINPEHLLAEGFHADMGTIAWLTKQDNAVRERFQEAMKQETPPLELLNAFLDWCERMKPKANEAGMLRFCGYGSEFDMPMVFALFHEFRVRLPIGHRGSFCLRTFSNTYEPMFEGHTGDVHTALADARWEAQRLVESLQMHWKAQAYLQSLNKDAGSYGATAYKDTEQVYEDFAKAILEQKDTQLAAEGNCLNRNCPECRGSMRRADGTVCVHSISCPCPRCSSVKL